MLRCKHCSSKHAVKNGKIRGKQRFRCRKCSFNFVEGDLRTNEQITTKKAMLILLYALGKAPFHLLARLFDSWPSQVYRWMLQAGLSLSEQKVAGTVKEMELDEMWHLVQERTRFGSSMPSIVAQGEPWPGWTAIVILRPSGGDRAK